jgi:hypothetical protein
VTLKVQLLRWTRFSWRHQCEMWPCWLVVGWIIVNISFTKIC